MFAPGVEAEVTGRRDDLFALRFHAGGRTVFEVLEAHGEVPLPPYITPVAAIARPLPPLMTVVLLGASASSTCRQPWLCQ